MFKHTLLLPLVLAITSAGGQAAIYSLSGAMDPLQATTNPGNVGSGFGIINGVYDDETNLLDYSVSWGDLTGAVTNMHFHLGAPGVSGGVELAIPGPWASPEVGSAIALSAAQETNLLAGNWYVNVHTGNFTGGEIRGQVDVTLVPEPSAALLSIGAVGLLLVRRARRA